MSDQLRAWRVDDGAGDPQAIYWVEDYDAAEVAIGAGAEVVEYAPVAWTSRDDPGTAEDLRAVRDAIDAASVGGEPMVAKRAEAAFQRITGTDHENRALESNAGWTLGPSMHPHLASIVSGPPIGREVRVVPAALAREGWRARIAHLESLMDSVLVGHTPRNPGAHVFNASEREVLRTVHDELRALLDGE